MSITAVVRSLTPLLFVTAIAACGGSGAATSTQAPKTSEASASDPSCPVSVPGTSVNVENTDSGAALVFVTTSDVGELRKRVTAMAQMHNDHHGSMGALPDGTDQGGHAGHDMSKMGSGGEHAGHAGGMIGVHSKAAASDVEGGAKITFTAGAADVAKLQSELRMHAQHFASGTCAMGK